MLITKVIENYTIRTQKELRYVYSKLDITKGNLVNMIGKNGYISFKDFKRFFRITPSDSNIGLLDYVDNLNNPKDRLQTFPLMQFILNFSKLDGALTHVGNLYVQLIGIDFQPSTESIELKFSFAKQNDTTLSHFRVQEIFKSILDAGYKSTYKETKYAYEKKKVHYLGQFAGNNRLVPDFDEIYKTFKIIVVDYTKKEYVLNFKTNIEVNHKRFFRNSDRNDLIIVKDFISLTYKEYCKLMESYDEYQKLNCIETLDTIDSEMDDIFKDFNEFHAEQVAPLIIEEDIEDDD